MRPSVPVRAPRTRFPNLEKRRRGTVFVWRARLQSAGETFLGPWRAEQRRAFDDVEELRTRVERRARRVLTVAAALADLLRDARRRQLEPITVRTMYRWGARFLVGRRGAEKVEGELHGYFDRGSLLESVGEADVVWFATEAHARGRDRRSLREKDLPLLDRAFRLAGLLSPVPAARARLRSMLKHRPKIPDPLVLADVVRILRDMRERVFEHDVPRRRLRQETLLAAREHHADLVELLATTGMRSGELERLKRDHFRAEEGIVAIPEPKDRSNPRVVPIGAAALPALQRLVQRADAQGRIVPGGMGYVSHALARWARRLKEPRLTARGLRHFYATELARRGTPLTSVALAMGHRNLTTTSLYAHGLLDPLKAPVDALAAALGGRAGTPEPEAGGGAQ